MASQVVQGENIHTDEKQGQRTHTRVNESDAKVNQKKLQSTCTTESWWKYEKKERNNKHYCQHQNLPIIEKRAKQKTFPGRKYFEGVNRKELKSLRQYYSKDSPL